MLKPSTLWAGLILYLVYLLAAGFIISRREQKKLGGRFNLMKTELTWPFLVMTYIASLMSTWVFFAGPGGYYRGGFGYWLSEMSYFPLFMIICHFTMNKVWVINRQRDYITPSDFFYDRFKSPALRVITALIFLTASFPYVTSVMTAIASAATVATGGAINYQAVLLAIGGVMIVFTAVGGFKSVAITDTLQGLVFIGLLWFIAIVVLIVAFGGSLITAGQTVWQNSIEWFSYPGPDHWVPYAARLGYPLSCAIGYTVMLPHVFVRAGFASKDLNTQRKLSYMAPALQGIVWTGTAVIGLVGIGLMPGLSTNETELIIPHLINNVIHGAYPLLATAMMIGFVIGAVAVGVSTADSFLLVSSSIIYEDILIKTFGMKGDEKKRLLVGRIVIFVIGTVCLVMAMDPPSIIYMMIMFAIAFVMPLFPIMVYGIYWKRATKQAAIVCAIVGTVLVIMTYQVWNIGWMWFGAIGMAANFVLMPIVSLMTKQDPKDAEDFYQALEKGMKETYVMEEVA
ncbi:sodium:solute symporter family protein [Deltaproteobacteria bacterium OttesenSCG-928-M10]|nr:sodium:solute symporter family protein [Deltaproteobacteria bacterium OttesenSCG-928-M10]